MQGKYLLDRVISHYEKMIVPYFKNLLEPMSKTFVTEN